MALSGRNLTFAAEPSRVKIYNSIDEFPGLSNAIVTIGTFDGVHQGHLQIINRLKQLAREHGEKALF